MESQSQQRTLVTDGAVDDVSRYLNLLLRFCNKLHDPAVLSVWPQLIVDDNIDWIGQVSCLQTQEAYCRLGATKLLNLADYFIALEQMIKNLRELSTNLSEINRLLLERIDSLEHELVLPFGYRATKHIYTRIVIIKTNRRFVQWHLRQINTKIASFQDAQNQCILSSNVSVQSHPWLYYDRCLSQNDNQAQLIAERLRGQIFTPMEEDCISEALTLRHHLGVAVVRNRPTTIDDRDLEAWHTEQWIAARV